MLRGPTGGSSGQNALGDLERVPVPALLRQVIEGRVARLGAEGGGDCWAVAAVIGLVRCRWTLWASARRGVDEDMHGRS